MSNRGLMQVGLKLEPDTFAALEAFADAKGLALAEAARAILEVALSDGAGDTHERLESAGYRAGMVRASRRWATLRTKIQELIAKEFE